MGEDADGLLLWMLPGSAAQAYIQYWTLSLVAAPIFEFDYFAQLSDLDGGYGAILSGFGHPLRFPKHTKS